MINSNEDIKKEIVLNLKSLINYIENSDSLYHAKIDTINEEDVLVHSFIITQIKNKTITDERDF